MFRISIFARKIMFIRFFIIILELIKHKNTINFHDTFRLRLFHSFIKNERKFTNLSSLTEIYQTRSLKRCINIKNISFDL